jgi:restriction system protein
MTAWIVRAGQVGEREDWALQNQIAGVDFHEVGDLTDTGTREAGKAAVLGAFPDATVGRQNNFAGQLWALRGTIKQGDVVVLPLKTTKKIAIGICSSGYTFRSQEGDSAFRHTIGVDWKRTDISRGAVKDDLLSTINGAMTIFQASKNHAEERLRAMIKTGIDPGSASSLLPVTKETATLATDDTAPEVVDPIPAPTMEVIRDRVRTFLVENFLQHKLTHLVADILRVQGYVCDVSPEGPDFGVDIIAGRGPLGLDSPTLIVECKSEAGQIGAQVIRGLQGAMASHKADQGLLVAWGGLNKPAIQAIRTDRLTIAVWDDEAVLDHLFAVYDQLPDETRARLPLKRAWVLDEETG